MKLHLPLFLTMPRRNVKVVVSSRNDKPEPSAPTAPKAVIKIRTQNEETELHGVFRERTYTMSNGRTVSAEFESFCAFRQRPHTEQEILRIRELSAIQHQFKQLRLEYLRALGRVRGPLTLDERNDYDSATTQLMRAQIREPYLFAVITGRH